MGAGPRIRGWKLVLRPFFSKKHWFYNGFCSFLQFFTVKPLFFFTFFNFSFHLHKERYKTNVFFTFFIFSLHLHKERYKTNAFFTFFNFSLHLHKERYKTNKCCLGSQCKGVICFHGLRVL